MPPKERKKGLQWEKHWFSCQQKLWTNWWWNNAEEGDPGNYLVFKRQHERTECSNAAFPAYSGDSERFWLNSPDRTHRIKGSNAICGPAGGKASNCGGGGWSEVGKRWKTNGKFQSTRTQKSSFICCCGELPSLLDTRPSLDLRIWPRSYKSLLIINHKSAFIIAYSASGVCLHLHLGLPPNCDNPPVKYLCSCRAGLSDSGAQGGRARGSFTSGKLASSLIRKTRRKTIMASLSPLNAPTRWWRIHFVGIQEWKKRECWFKKVFFSGALGEVWAPAFTSLCLMWSLLQYLF